MQNTATVNYHIASSEPQAFYIDADGETGKLLSPELVPTQVRVQDLGDGEVSVDFVRDSVSFVRNTSSVRDFGGSDDWQKTYDEELKQLLRQQLGAEEVVIFDHTVRTDDPESERQPARNVHSDYSPSGAHQRLKDILGHQRASEWETGHFGFVNIWRPIRCTIQSTPLGFVLPRSLGPKDWVPIELIYPNRTGQIMGLIPNESHEWVYLSKMTPEDVAIFNIYDNRGLASIAHSALDMAGGGNARAPRMSIESRTLVKY